MTITHIGIIGAGTMGNGIAQVAAASGFHVVLQDLAQAQLDRALGTIGGSLDRLIRKGSLNEEQKAQVLGRIQTTTEREPLRGCGLVVEAATEDEGIKLQILRGMDGMLPPETIIATNTSSISLTRLAAATSRPDRFIGMHFFNPVPVMQLVEIIRGLQTSDQTLQTIEAVARAMGKTPIDVRNSPGFVVNRILCPMINEAIFALGEGLASAEAIDAGMKLGCNHPIGPLALADMIGLDVMLAVMDVLYRNFRDPKYRAAPLLVEMVDAGYLGRKSGKGFYSYG